MNINKKTAGWVLGGVLGLGALAGAYCLGAASGDKNPEVKDEYGNVLTDDESAVTQRVSEQMAEIAQQQKEISDEQRTIAEQESEAARQAEGRAKEQAVKAEQAADEADKQRSAAEVSQKRAEESAQEATRQEEQAKTNLKLAEKSAQEAKTNLREAEMQRDQATRAKRTADTLTYRTLGKNLANTSLAQYQGNHRDVAATLAYTSWYFLDKYNANTYHPTTFRALSTSLGARKTASMNKKGAVYAVKPYQNGFFAASDYGEIELVKSIDGKKHSISIIQNPAYDFRDLCIKNDILYAVSMHGPMVIIPTKNSNNIQTAVLPQDSYMKIVDTGKDALVIAGKQYVCWYDTKTHKVTSTTLKKQLSAIAKRGDKGICLFFQDGSKNILNGDGTLSQLNLPINGVVTAAYYEPRTKCLFLGKKNGDVDIVNRNNILVTALLGHNSRITDITEHENLMVTASYDKTVRIWNLPMLYLDGNMSYKDAVNTTKMVSLEGKQVKSDNLAKEWVVGVDCPFNGWPLSLCYLNGSSEIIVGTSDGTLQKMETSIDRMAQQVKSQMRNLTEPEWNQFVGVSVDYRKFK